MGRKLSYCKSEALAKATQLFSSRGYEKTCMRDVASEVSVPVASLYHTFGDKNALLAASLESYFQNTMRPAFEALTTAPSPFAAIEAFFMGMIENCAANKDRDGCIMLHAATELMDEAPEAAKAAKRMMGYARDQFTIAITRGQTAGEVTSAHDAEFLSAHLMANMIAIKTWLRMGASAEQLRNYAGQALGILRK